MERKLKKLLIATGVIAGIATAFLPLTSYAANSASKNLGVSVTVASVLTLDISVLSPDGSTDENMSFNVAPNTVSEGIFTAKVTTNKPYSLYVHAKDGKTDMLPPNETAEEATNKIPGTGEISVGSTSWGIKLADAASYSPIPAAMSNPVRTSTSPNSPETTTFNIGVAVGPSLAPGTYSSTLVITATNSAAD